MHHISLSGLLWLTLLCKNNYLSLLVMSKEVHGHLFPLLCRHWVLKRTSPPALLMMRMWTAATRRRVPSTWLVMKLTI